MNTLVVMQQMVIIFILIGVGVFLYRIGRLDDKTSKDISFIVINICNPLTLISSALSSTVVLTVKHLFFSIFCFVVLYAILFVMSYVIPVILRVERKERFAYSMLALFSNVGFIGIPFVSAVLGTDALIYVSICCLVFNLIIYTHGMNVMRAAGRWFNPNMIIDEPSVWKKLINFGTISSIVTIIIYATNLRLPSIVCDSAELMGRCTTFLSMLVLGNAVAKMNPKKVFGNIRLYFFTVIRFMILPLIISLIMRMYITDINLYLVLVIMSALPCANMPLMMAKEYNAGEDTISSGIILTTLLSIITITFVSLFI